MPESAAMRGSFRAWVVLAALSSPFVAGGAGAQAPPAERPLVVGTYEDPPFSMKTETGEWNGLAIELWHEVAKELGRTYELREIEPSSTIFDAVGRGELDVVAAAVPVTSERLEKVEYTTTFLSKTFAIATVPSGSQGFFSELGLHFSPRLRFTLLAIVALFVVSSFGIWWIERRRNPEHFGGHAGRGIGEAFWWTAATVTTVGYGDRTPLTLAGRTFAVFVMFTAIVLVSIFTGIVASQLTVRQLHGRVHGLSDLNRARVGVVEGSPMEAFLTDRGILYSRFPDVEGALRALADGRLDAVVAGEPELQYHAERTFTGRIAIVPGMIDQGFLAFVVPEGSRLRRPINAALVKVLESPTWASLCQQHLNR